MAADGGREGGSLFVAVINYRESMCMVQVEWCRRERGGERGREGGGGGEGGGRG